MKSLVCRKVFLFYLMCLSTPWIESETRPLKILFVLHEFPKFVQPFILNQITGFIDKGHLVYIYANNKLDGITPPAIKRYNLLSRTYYQGLPHNLKDLDILYCQFGIDGCVGLALKNHYNLSGKIVVCFRGDDITQFLKSDPQGKRFRSRGPFKIPCYYPEMYDELFKKADLFLPVCSYFAQIALAHGCDPTKISVHHSAIDLNQFTFKKRELDSTGVVKLITVGRLVELKGTEYLIRAMAKLEKVFLGKVRLYVIGDGPEKYRLMYLRQSLHLDNNVFFLGWQPHHKIKSLLSQAHIFVLPSITTRDGITEGIPNALMEAMATGMPVVSTYHGGIPELVRNNVNGFLVPEGDVDALADRLSELIRHPEIWESLGRSGSQHIRSYHNVELENERLERIFYELVGENL